MPAARLSSRHLVGRLGELAELELACRDAIAGRPSLVLVSGESGVGKTRLITELQRRIEAFEPAPVVLRSEAVEHGDTELPYAALLGALRPLARQHDPVLEALSPGSRAQLASLLPALGSARTGPGPADGSGQLRLFEALLELFAALSERAPVVLCLEDVHWADRSSRTFIAYLARSLRTERILLLLSFRSDELHRRHPLLPILAEIERLERARRVELAPFDRHELAEALADILGSAPGEELVERLLTRSQGNPLYVEELLAAGLDGRGAPPQSLRDAFLLRIERLSADAQVVTRAIAVGGELDEPQLTALTGLESAPLAIALRESLAEQVLRSGAGGFSFRHELLREAVHDDLLPGERTELHRVLARYLEAAEDASAEGHEMGDSGADGGGHGAGERAARIARHYEAAGDQPAALRASVRAALAAVAMHAYGEAADLCERALELWPRVLGARDVLEVMPGESGDQIALIMFAAHAHMVGGDRSRAEVLLRSALAGLDAEDDPRRCATVLTRLARAEWSLNRPREALATAERALALLPENDDGPERTALLAWRARTHVLRGRYRDAIEGGERALAAAEALGDRSVEGWILNTLGMAQMALGQEPAGQARLVRAIEIARADDDPDSLATACANLADLLLLRGHTKEALQVARDGLAEIPRWFGRSREWLVLSVSEMALEAGNLPLAREHIPSFRTPRVGITGILRGLRIADLALAEGEDAVAERELVEIEPLLANSIEPQWIGLLGALMAELHRRRGELAEARAAVATALDRMELCTEDVMRISRVTVIGARVEADFAQRGRDLRARAIEREAIKRARLHADRLRAAAADGGPVEQAGAVTGRAELARARGRHDPGAWRVASEAWEAVGRPYPAAVALLRVAEAHAERGDREAAASAAAEALARARELGAHWLAGEVEALCERARLRPEARAGTDRNGAEAHAAVGTRAETSDPFALTPRERQVLALVSQGATNRQIGTALFMAEKTASVHVSRILAKLGVSSRTQAAAVAHRLHLV